MSNNRDLGDAVAESPVVAESKWPEWLTGTNFYGALLIFIGSAWGITEPEVSDFVVSISGVIGAALAFRERIKATTVNWLQWVRSPNTVNYLFAALAFAIPKLPAGLGDKVSAFIEALFSKNWANVISAALALLAFIYFAVIKGRFSK